MPDVVGVDWSSPHLHVTQKAPGDQTHHLFSIIGPEDCLCVALITAYASYVYSAREEITDNGAILCLKSHI